MKKNEYVDIYPVDATFTNTSYIFKDNFLARFKKAIQLLLTSKIETKSVHMSGGTMRIKRSSIK
jgi:hypothetical protein